MARGLADWGGSVIRDFGGWGASLRHRDLILDQRDVDRAKDLSSHRLNHNSTNPF